MIKKWWHEKTAYQIYPKSFLDTTGNGIGDLRGIINKLDYLKELGIGIVWLSPIYCSPFADQGYDISDYYNIHPSFGTMEDFDELLAEAKKRDISILMDLVVNHCSDEHEWFKKACEDPDGEYGKFFYIRDWHEGEPLPCNWRSYFGGSCWDLLPGHTDKVYLHVFHKKQPDLNWENPKVREEIYKMMNWWLDKGLAGFRIDAIINIKKLLPFCDFPADREDGLSCLDHMLAAATGIDEFLTEMKEKTFLPHDALSVGEVFNMKDSELEKFIGENGHFSSMFDFKQTAIGRDSAGWHTWKLPTAEEYKQALFDSQKEVSHTGFYSTLIENHDLPRGVSHFIPAEDLNDASKKMIGGIPFLAKGLPFIYQGQEIGMENIQVSDVSMIDDISALSEYQVSLDAGLSKEKALKITAHYSRDNARTPFQWDASENAGFTSGTPWLPVNPNYKTINFEDQKNREDSVFHFYKQLSCLRNSSAYKNTLIYGDFEPYLAEQKNLIAYTRSAEQKLLIVANFQREPQKMALPSPIKNVLLNNLDTLSYNDNFVSLESYQFVVFEL